MAGGFLFLLLDLGRPFRMWRLFVHFNPGSVASWGVFMGNIFLICSVIYAAYLFRGSTKGLGAGGAVGIPFAITVSGYSGMLLFQMKAHPLWHSSLIPVLFSVSALASGIALVILGAILYHVEREKIQRMGKLLAAFIGFDLLLVLVELITLFNGHQEAVEGAKLLLAGVYTPLFLGFYLILGMVVPLLILMKRLVSIGSGRSQGPRAGKKQ